ncbi:MAG TPA: hypothetical protein VHZ03_48760 [Trebonia sp.]|jgi:hypothetical protein|nr:hypothetical protein [Trebonia sp.]
MWRQVLAHTPIPVGYGVELAVLIDTVQRHGLGAIAQVDLGERAHRNQPDADLAVMAAELLLVAERRRAPSADALRAGPGERRSAKTELCQFTRQDGALRPVLRPVPSEERDPARSLAGFGPAGESTKLLSSGPGRLFRPDRRPIVRVIAGQTLSSVTDMTSVIVVRAPDEDVQITCGGQPMAAGTATPPAGATSAVPAPAVGTQLGKRYENAAATIELLCIKAGPGSLAVDGETLTIKAAKPLPASD